MDDSSKELINMLRQEAYQVKECAVQYFVRTIMFVTAFIGAIMVLQQTSDYVFLASIFALFVLSATARILLHKYGTANRNLGYELHLEKSKNLADLHESESSWNDDYLNIGWEEAMRAWRIVQATVFEAVCGKRYNKYKVDLEKIKFPWFDIKKLINYGEGASYYAGSFLKKTISILNTLMFVALVPILIFIIESWGDWYAVSFGGVIFVTAIGYVAHTIVHNHYRLYQLESGILSIPTCAIIWHIVVLAHYRALDIRKTHKGHAREREKGYPYIVSVLAKKLANNVGQIDDWIEGKDFRSSVRHSCATRKALAEEKTKLRFTLSDYSENGLGLIIDTKPSLKIGDKISFDDKDMLPVIVAHISRRGTPFGNKYLVGAENAR